MKSNPASLVPPWNARQVFEATLVVIGASPHLANLVSRLNTLLSKARQALSNQGALPPAAQAEPGPSGLNHAGAAPASAAPSSALSEARRR